MQTNGPFHFVLDDDPNAQGGYPSDTMERLRDDVLVPQGLPCTYDETDAFVRTATQMGGAIDSRDTVETVATIPEPSGLTLLLAGAVLLCPFRSR